VGAAVETLVPYRVSGSRGRAGQGPYPPRKRAAGSGGSPARGRREEGSLPPVAACAPLAWRQGGALGSCRDRHRAVLLSAAAWWNRGEAAFVTDRRVKLHRYPKLY